MARYQPVSHRATDTGASKVKRWIVGAVIALLALYVIAVEAGAAYSNARWDECREATSGDTDAYIECIGDIPFTFSGFANLANQ